MTRAEDVSLAVTLGVDFIGLVFAERSPRRLGIEQALALRALVPQRIGLVALLMDSPRGEIDAIAAALRPDYLQFHGGEDDGFCRGFGLPFLKAIAMGEGDDPREPMTEFPSAHAFVLDGHATGEQGGSGRRFDWTLLSAALDQPFLLAGGLTQDNVTLAIATAKPWGVDVASGIESSPGVKDAEKMRTFVAAVRAADADRLG